MTEGENMGLICRSSVLTGSSLWAVPAHAYIGPGVGLSAIGSVLAFVAVVLLLLAGLLWYPVKKLMKRRSRKIQQGHAKPNRPDEDSDQASGF